jgi:hypothetical protein
MRSATFDTGLTFPQWSLLIIMHLINVFFTLQSPWPVLQLWHWRVVNKTGGLVWLLVAYLVLTNNFARRCHVCHTARCHWLIFDHMMLPLACSLYIALWLVSIQSVLPFFAVSWIIFSVWLWDLNTVKLNHWSGKNVFFQKERTVHWIRPQPVIAL